MDSKLIVKTGLLTIAILLAYTLQFTIAFAEETFRYKGYSHALNDEKKQCGCSNGDCALHNVNIKSCSKLYVCNQALDGHYDNGTNVKVNRFKKLNQGGFDLWNAVIREAKARGYTEQECFDLTVNFRKKEKRSKLKKNTPKITLLRNSFNNISKDQRKFIQRKLSAEGYYKSAIDGLYGKGTAAALKTYNKEYLNNADLNKSANVTTLLDNLLKEKLTSVEAEPKVKVTLNLGAGGLNVELEANKTAQLKENATPPRLKFAQVKAAYDAGNYSQAFKDAQILSIEGDPNAQLYLGKMYADGRGALQISTTAHMWFNIATLNGSAEAFEERQKIALIMTPSAVEEAQKMAMTCIQSSYRDCGLSVKPITISKPQEYARPTAKELQRYFRALSTLERKQVQYALKKLGYYQSGVDGLYGRGTKTALENYLSEAKSIKHLSQVYAELTSQVQVPTAFAAPKRTSKTTTSSTTKITAPYGWRLVTNNPIHSYEQADAICKPMSQNAGNSVRMPNTNNNYNCYGSGNSFNCNNNASSPEAAFINGLARGMMKSKTRRRAYASCMAQYGWVED